MYMDETANFKGDVRIVIRFAHTDGTPAPNGSRTKTFSDAEGDDWVSTSYDFNFTAKADPGKKLREAAVYGYTKSAADGSPWVLKKERHVFY